MNDTVAQVVDLVDLIEGASPLDIGDLDYLAVDLPQLRRPRGRDGARDVARYCELPLALRAVTVFYVLRAEVANGGVDQFVWNQFSILSETLQAFHHIGALDAVEELVALGETLVREESFSEGDAVQKFLAFCSQRTPRNWDSETEIVRIVADAILRHARAFPEEFVTEVVEVEEWNVGGEALRTEILRRPNGVLEVALYKAVLHEVPSENASVPMLDKRWYEMPRDAECFHTVDAARDAATREQRRLSVAPSRCNFAVSVWSPSYKTMKSQLWSKEALALEVLPVGVPLSLRIHLGGRELTAVGKFEVDSLGGRYGRIIMDDNPPDDANQCRDWQAECVVIL